MAPAMGMSGKRPIFSAGGFPPLLQTLSDEHYFREIKSCYRWMSKYEARRWMRGELDMGGIPFDDFLGRVRRKTEIIFCWSDPVGALMGRNPGIDNRTTVAAPYGRLLMRMDFVSDPVYYSRNTGEYFHQSASNVPLSKKFKKDVDSEIVYSAYAIAAYPETMSFHEYTIRSAAVIQGWTFSDDALKTQFRNRYEARKNGDFDDLRDMHFPLYAYEDDYYQELELKKASVEKFWKEEMVPEYFSNPKSRAAIP